MDRLQGTAIQVGQGDFATVWGTGSHTSCLPRKQRCQLHEIPRLQLSVIFNPSFSGSGIPDKQNTSCWAGSPISAHSQCHRPRVLCHSMRLLGDEEELGCAERCPPGFSCDSLIPFSDRITGCWEISDLKTSTLRFLFSICQNNIENRLKTGGRSMKMGRKFAI